MSLNRESNFDRCAVTSCKIRTIHENGFFLPDFINAANIRSERVRLIMKQFIVDCIAITLSAYNDTSVQPQTHAMGAACRDPAGGEIPMMRINYSQFM